LNNALAYYKAGVVVVVNSGVVGDEKKGWMWSDN
jgi:hypothetical protein